MKVTIRDDLYPHQQIWQPPKDFPRNLLTELPEEEDVNKELDLILGTPYEYFKIRVKHFEIYQPSSYDAVLVNRKKEL